MAFFKWFFKFRLPCKSLCLRCLLTIFFSNILFFSEWWIGSDWRSPSSHGVEFNKEINFVSIKTYLCYLEYLQEENGLLGCQLVCSDWKSWQQRLYLKIFLSHWNQQILGLTVSKMSVMSVIFNLYLFDYSSI